MKLKENRKIQMLFCVLSVVLIWGIYAVMVKWIRWDVEKDNAITAWTEFDSNILAEIDEVQENNGKLKFLGWALRVDSEIKDVKIVLQETAGTESQVIETTVAENNNLKQYIKYLELEENYSNGGFLAEVKESKLKKKSCYELLLYLNYEEEITKEDGSVEHAGKVKKVTTAQYLYDGKIYNYNPKEFIEPEFIEKSMQRVIQEGRVCAYNPEKRAWVYLYEENLYWILDKTVEVNCKEPKKVYLHLYSTDIKKLPENRQVYLFDNLDFYFKDFQFLPEEESLYCVAKAELNVKYPVTYVRTGLYDHETDEKYWSLEFRLPVAQ